MIDASKLVSVDGLLQLGWVEIRGADNCFVYPAPPYLAKMACYSILSTSPVWKFDKQNLWGKLAPRTLAEVKFLMDRMMEDD